MTLLTVPEAAERVRLSPSMIYQICDERRLPHLRAGGKSKRGKILIELEDLERFLESIKVEARSE